MDEEGGISHTVQCSAKLFKSLIHCMEITYSKKTCLPGLQCSLSPPHYSAHDCYRLLFLSQASLTFSPLFQKAGCKNKNKKPCCLVHPILLHFPAFIPWSPLVCGNSQKRGGRGWDNRRQRAPREGHGNPRKGVEHPSQCEPPISDWLTAVR